MNFMQILRASEDYLEAMLMMQKEHGYVRSIDIAEKLGVTKPSVMYAIKRLRENLCTCKGVFFCVYRAANTTTPFFFSQRYSHTQASSVSTAKMPMYAAAPRRCPASRKPNSSTSA